MQVGDLVKLTEVGGNGRLAKLRGIILKIFIDPEGYKKTSIIWTDGDKTQEWPEDLEVVYK
tara:strand:- start:11698 stop:11880 length:183 start_codon:yes stop_codon:yes gene_type:complete